MKLKKKIALSSVAMACLYAPLNTLANETVKLQEVTVTSASGFEQKITDAPASISVISKEDLQKKPYTNLLDAVKDIEGVDIGESTDKSGQGVVSMRGMGSDYTLVLIDGKKQNNNGDIYPNGFGGLQFANIPPLSMIERIEVVRGPMSTLYGADAMGGVINIITKKVSNEWTGSITHGQTFQGDSSWGNENTTDVAIMGPLIKDKLGLSLRGSYYDKEESQPQWESDTFNNNGVIEDSSQSNESFGGNGKTMKNQNWTAGIGLTLTPNENHTIRADFDIAKQKYDNTNGSVGTLDNYETLFKNQRVGYANYQRIHREQYSINWESFWNVGKSTLGVHHIQSENLGRSLPLSSEQRKYIDDNKPSWADLNDALADPFFAALMPRPARTLESTNTTYDAKYELPLEAHYIVFGAQYLQATMKDGVFGMNEGKTDGKKEYAQYSVFAEDSYSISDALIATFGARYDNHEDFGGHLSPRAYLTYTLNENWTVKGGVSTGYKTPKTSDLQEGIVGFGGQGTSPMIGNPDLKPEESVSKEIAVYYEHENRHNFNLTLFQNDFKNKIEEDDAKGGISAQWAALGYDPKMKQNVGEAEILGLEASGKFYFMHNLSIKANWTYMDSEIKSDSPTTNARPLTSSPKHLYSATLDYQATPKFNTYLQYSGEKDRFNTRYGTSNKDLYYKDFSVWNLGTSYKVNESLTFNARVNNVLDKDFLQYNTVAKGSGRTPYYYEQYSNIIAPRNFWLSATYTF
jgi:outer membrane receptor for ferrienterochelin and colicins